MIIHIEPVARAVLLDMLNNIATMLERGYDPKVVAKQCRDFIAKTEAAYSGKSVQCPHCRWGFDPRVIDQHIREKHS